MSILERREKSKRVEFAPVPARPDEAEIREWLVAKVARVVGVPTSDVDPALSFVEFGLDSMQSVRLSGDLERWMGYELPPILLYDYPTIDSLARYLAENPAGPTAA
jgi:acyl carrier protein